MCNWHDKRLDRWCPTAAAAAAAAKRRMQCAMELLSWQSRHSEYRDARRRPRSGCWSNAIDQSTPRRRVGRPSAIWLIVDGRALPYRSRLHSEAADLPTARSSPDTAAAAAAAAVAVRRHQRCIDVARGARYGCANFTRAEQQQRLIGRILGGTTDGDDVRRSHSCGSWRQSTPVTIGAWIGRWAG